MKRCYYCRRMIWSWQRRYLGLTPAHADCDLWAFAREVRELGRLFPFQSDCRWAEDQIEKRRKGSYGGGL